jgi:hypothetical protein
MKNASGLPLHLRIKSEHLGLIFKGPSWSGPVLPFQQCLFTSYGSRHQSQGEIISSPPNFTTPLATLHYLCRSLYLGHNSWPDIPQLFFFFFLLHFVFEAGSCCVAQASLECEISCPGPPEFWDYSCTSSKVTSLLFFQSVCVCVCVCVQRESERKGERERE